MIWLIFAHFIGDWGLQNRWMADNKVKYWEVLFAHSIIYTACICIALEYLGVFNIYQAIFLIVGHCIIDEWKASNYKNEKDRWMLWIDHLLHFVQLIVVYRWII